MGRREQTNTRLLVRAMEQVFNAANLAAVDELYAPDFVNHVPPSLGRELRGCEQLKQNIAHWRSALPDLVHQVEDVPAFELSRIANGRIAEQWLSLDTLGPAQQLGTAPLLNRPRSDFPRMTR